MTVPCPHCGEEIRADAKFCQHCGSSDADGWRDESGDDAGDDDFDYDEFVEENFSGRATNTKTRPLWRLVAVVLLLAFLFGTLVLFR
jgi:sarcosine oxidase delta subunit